MRSCAYLFLVIAVVVSACNSQTDDRASVADRMCPAPLLEDGFVTLKKKIDDSNDEVNLRLPAFVLIQQGAAAESKCEYVDSFQIDYRWSNGQLIPGWTDEDPQAVLVRVFEEGLIRASDATIRDAWRFDPSVPHSRFPLDYYPSWSLDAPGTPGVNSARYWGVRDTKYKELDGFPFLTFCSMEPSDWNQPAAVATASFADYGDSKCRGAITSKKNEVAIRALIDVYDEGATEINLIYDAVIEQLQAFIQE